MKLYCDMDMVLVRQIAREGFDRFPWMDGGKELWAAIKGLRPILLTQVRGDRFGKTAEEKLTWIDRELGAGVAVIFTPDSRGKGPFARPGDVLIDDSTDHCAAWQKNGGTPILHLAPNVAATLAALKALQ